LCFKEETDANAPKDPCSPDLPYDRVLGSRMRADGHADGAIASLGGAPLELRHNSLGE